MTKPLKIGTKTNLEILHQIDKLIIRFKEQFDQAPNQLHLGKAILPLFLDALLKKFRNRNLNDLKPLKENFGLVYSGLEVRYNPWDHWEITVEFEDIK